MKNASCIYKCDECSYQNYSEKGLRQHKKKKHKIILVSGEDEQIEQFDGQNSLPLDSPTNPSAENTLSESKLTGIASHKETKSEKEIEDGLARLPKLGDPDDVVEKFIKQLDCYKITNMSEH